MAVQVVRNLDYLLLGGADVGDVGHRELGGDLLLDGDARAQVWGGRGGAEAGRAGIDPEPGDTKQTLRAAAQLAGNRFREQRRGTTVAGGSGLSGDPPVYRTRRTGLAEGQKSHDVVSGQRRIGARGQGHIACLSREI